MPNATSSESTIQFRQSFVADFWLSLLDVVLSLGPTSPLQVPRQLGASHQTPSASPTPGNARSTSPGAATQGQPGKQGIALWWDAPHLAFDDRGEVLLTLNVHGGYRHPKSGRILSFEGPVRARMKPLVYQYPGGVSYLGLQPVALDVQALGFHYAGKPLPQTRENRENKDLLAPLATMLQADLFERLAQLPLTFTNRFVKMDRETTRVRILGPKQGNAIIIGNAAPNSGPHAADSTRLQERLSAHPDCNFALTFSAEAINQEMERTLADQDDIADINGERLAKLDRVEIQLAANGAASLLVSLSKGVVSASASMDLHMALAPEGQLRLQLSHARLDFETMPHPVASRDNREPHKLQEAASGDIRQAAEIIGARYCERLVRAALGQQSLVQRFSVLDGQLKMEVAPKYLDITSGLLTLYYAIPLKPPAALPPIPLPPVATIAIEPVEATTSALSLDPLTTVLRAQIVTPSYPPYDYAWSCDGGRSFLGDHAQEITINRQVIGKSRGKGKPSGAPRVPVTLAVIDGFGRVAQASREVTLGKPGYLPLPPPEVPVGALALVGAGRSGASGVAQTPLELPGPTEALPDAPLAPFGPRSRPLETAPKNKRRWAVVSLVLIASLLICSGAYLLLSAGSSGANSGHGLSLWNPFAAQSTQTTDATTGTGANSTVTPGGSNGFGGGGTATAGSSTVTPGGPTVTPQPTATAVPGAFSVSEVQVQQQCTLTLPLSSFTVTLYNQTNVPVGYQTTVVSTMPGTSTPWASVSPPNGTIAAGANQQVVITPNSGLCSNQLLRGTQQFTLTISAVSGASGTFTITDSVTGSL